MTDHLEGRLAVVTASNSGIGRAIAVAFGKEGATVTCANRREESKLFREQDITTYDLTVKNGGKTEYVQTVNSDWKSIDTLFEKVKSQHGRMDILVNCAADLSGTDKGLPFWDMSEEDFKNLCDVNFGGMLHCTQAASKIMKEQDTVSNGDRGWIINIGSAWTSKSAPTVVAHIAAKNAVVTMTKSIAAALGEFRIHANVIQPGCTKTSTLEGFPPEMVQSIGSKQAFGMADPDDIAGAAVFLASDDARWTTGSGIWVDGGFSVSW